MAAIFTIFEAEKYGDYSNLAWSLSHVLRMVNLKSFRSYYLPKMDYLMINQKDSLLMFPE